MSDNAFFYLMFSAIMGVMIFILSAIIDVVKPELAHSIGQICTQPQERP